MSGFPNRPARPAFGPERENERAVQNPERELDAKDMNLDFWQVSGMGLVTPRVTLLVGVTGAAIVSPHGYQGVAWDPKQLLPELPVTYVGVGDYQLILQPTYPDQLGNAVATALKGGKATPQGTGNLNGIVDIFDPVTVNIKLFTADTGAAVDSNFLLELW